MEKRSIKKYNKTMKKGGCWTKQTGCSRCPEGQIKRLCEQQKSDRRLRGGLSKKKRKTMKKGGCWTKQTGCSRCPEGQIKRLCEQQKSDRRLR